MMEIIVLKQMDGNISEVNLSNIHLFNKIGEYNCTFNKDLSFIFDKYNLTYKNVSLSSFKTYSEVNSKGEYIWLHSSLNSDYIALKRSLTISEITTDDTIS